MVYAAGCVLAACHEYNEARDIFAQVREATADFAEVWMNIAHIYVQQQQYMAAVHMYENCIRKFRRVHNVDLLLYLARAQFMADKLAAAKATLLRARTVAPHDTLVLYNLALVLKHGTLRQIADDKVAYTNIVAAQSELRVAHAYFTLLARPPDAASGMHNRHVDRHMAASEQRSCADILQQMPTHIARARALDERERQLRARQQLEREALKERTLEEERERQSLAEQQLQDLKQRRQEYIEKTRDVLFIPQVNEPERGGKSSKSRRRAGADGARDDFVNDSSDLGEYAGGDGEGGAEGGGEPRPKKSKADRRRERRQREKQRQVFCSYTHFIWYFYCFSRRQAVVDEPKLSAKQAARVKSKAYVSSSDGESDGDDALNIAEHDPTTTTRMNDGSG
jgi:RNA polymerase-associated protein CTR9